MKCLPVSRRKSTKLSEQEPIGVVDQAGRVALDLEIEQVSQLLLDALHVALDLLAGEQVALGGFAARVADHAGAAAGQGDGGVAEALQARQGNQRDGVTDVQAVAVGSNPL